MCIGEKSSRGDEIEKFIDDVRYVIVWGVSLDSSRKVKATRICSVMDLERAQETQSLFSEYTPSENYTHRAEEEFKQ